MPASPYTVRAEERLLGLVVSLLATSTGRDKAEILSTVAGYKDEYDPHGDNSKLDRKFERDKELLRELGIPLETVDAPGDPGNNQTVRYRIPKDDYVLPAGAAFSPAEIGMINLAGELWRHGSLATTTARGLMKLRAQAVTPEAAMIGMAPRIRTLDPAFENLNLAINNLVEVIFPYLRPGSANAHARTVRPHALFQFRGHWYLRGHDAYRDAETVFLLSRIVGPVRITKASFSAPAGDPAAEALAELQAFWEAHTAVVEVEPGTDAATRLPISYGAPAGSTRLELHYADAALLAQELAGFGPEVLVVEPAEVRDRVIATLRAARDGAAPRTSPTAGGAA